MKLSIPLWIPSSALGLGVLACLSACNQGSQGEAEILSDLQTWATTYGGKGTQRARDIRQTADGGFIVVGETEHFGPGETDAWIMKQDPDGNVMWSRSIGDANLLLTGNAGMNWGANAALDSNQIEVLATHDGGCIMAGGAFEGIVAGDDVNEVGPVWQPAVVKLDADGHVQWRRIYEGGARGGRFLDIEDAGDGGWALAGYVEKVGSNLDLRNRDLLILKTDPEGNEEWRQVFGGAQHEVATCITVDLGALPGDPPFAFAVGGIKGREGGEKGNDGFLLKIGYPGRETLIDKVFGARQGVNVFDIEDDPYRPSYLLVGAVKDDVNDHYFLGTAQRFDGIVFSFRSSDGEPEWNRVIEMAPIFDNAPDYAFALTRAVGDLGWYVAGFGGVLSSDGAMVRLTDDGELDPAETRSFGETEVMEEFHDVKRTADGAYIAVGHKGDRAWVVKIGINMEVDWEATLEFPGGAARAYSVTETHRFGLRTGYLVAGAGAAGGFVVKLDLQGNERWRKSVHDKNDEIAHAVRQTDDDGDGERDDGYIVVGSNESRSRNAKDSWVLKLEADGSIDWQMVLGGGFDDESLCVEITSDRGYVVGGSTRTPSGSGDTPGDQDSWIYKLDTDGFGLWQSIYNEAGSTGWEKLHCLRETGDGSLILAGEGFGGAFVMKLDQNGDADSAWGSPTVFPDRIARSVRQTRGGGYIVAGWAPFFDLTDDVWVAKLDAGGRVVAQARYSGPGGGDAEDRAYAVVETATGFAVAGHTRSFGGGQLRENERGIEVLSSNIWVLHLDQDLSVDWERTYSTPTEDKAYAMITTRDGSLVVAGETDTSFLDTTDTGPRGIDGFILRMRADGTISRSCDDQLGLPSAATVWQNEPDPYRRPQEPRFTHALLVDQDYELHPFDAIGNVRVDTLCFDQARRFRLTLDITGRGRVRADALGIDCASSCSVDLLEGTLVRLTAIADPGWEFLGFDPDCPDGEVRMDRDITCHVVFAGGEEPGEETFYGYWNLEYARVGFCGEEQTNESGTEQLMITLNGSQATIDNFTIGEIYTGTVAGNVLTWDVTYQTAGESITESGTFTLSPDGTTLGKSAEYVVTRPGRAPCSGICTGTGRKL